MSFEFAYEWVLGWRYTRAGRATRRNGFISFISGVSMLGIGLGVAALVIVLSVMNGFQKEVRESTPALPWEVSSPGACWSTKVTRQPLACKAKAHETPTMPAPSTVTCRLVSKRFMVLFCLKSFWINF